MKIATTTADFGAFCRNDIDRIRELHRAGFRYVDLSMYSFTPDCDYMKDNWRDAVNTLKKEADALGMTLCTTQSSDSSLGSAMLAGIAVGVFANAKDAVAHCVKESVTVTPNFANTEAYARIFEDDKRIHDALAPIYGDR